MSHSSACLDENGSKFITQSSDQHGYLFYGQRGSSVSNTNYPSGHLTPGVNLATQWLQKKIRARLFFRNRIPGPDFCCRWLRGFGFRVFGVEERFLFKMEIFSMKLPQLEQTYRLWPQRLIRARLGSNYIIREYATIGKIVY